MKKWAVLFLVLLVTGTGAFALDMAAGGGILYNWSSTGGTEKGDGDFGFDVTRNGFGAFGFFGFSQYAELNLGFLYKSAKVKVSDFDGEITLDSAVALQLGIYGKYPIPVSDSFVFFPTGGVDLELTLGGSEAVEGQPMEWWHDFWLRGGVGMDFFLSERMFIRSHLIYGVGIPMGGPEELDLGITHGLLVKAGIGFML